MVNESALYYEHISSVDGSVIDYFYLMKGEEYPYLPEEATPFVPLYHPVFWIIVMMVVLLLAVGAYRAFRRKQIEEDSLEQSMIKDKEAETLAI